MNHYDLTKAAKALKQGRLHDVLSYLLEQHASGLGVKLVALSYDDEYTTEPIEETPHDND